LSWGCDSGRYLVSIWIIKKMKENKRRRKRRKKCKRYRLCFCLVELCHERSLSTIKAKSCRIFCQEVHKAINDYVFTGLDSSLSTRAVDRELREESLTIFSNGSMSSGHANETYAQRVHKAYNKEP